MAVVCQIERESVNPAGGSRPSFDLGPQPHVTVSKEGHRVGELAVAATPIVHDLRPFDVQAARDLGGIHEIVQVHLSPHADDRTPGVPQRWVNLLRRS